jgi:hypothetical protein
MDMCTGTHIYIWFLPSNLADFYLNKDLKTNNITLLVSPTILREPGKGYSKILEIRIIIFALQP